MNKLDLFAPEGMMPDGCVVIAEVMLLEAGVRPGRVRPRCSYMTACDPTGRDWWHVLPGRTDIGTSMQFDFLTGITPDTALRWLDRLRVPKDKSDAVRRRILDFMAAHDLPAENQPPPEQLELPNVGPVPIETTPPADWRKPLEGNWVARARLLQANASDLTVHEAEELWKYHDLATRIGLRLEPATAPSVPSAVPELDLAQAERTAANLIAAINGDVLPPMAQPPHAVEQTEDKSATAPREQSQQRPASPFPVSYQELGLGAVGENLAPSVSSDVPGSAEEAEQPDTVVISGNLPSYPQIVLPQGMDNGVFPNPQVQLRDGPSTWVDAETGLMFRLFQEGVELKYTARALWTNLRSKQAFPHWWRPRTARLVEGVDYVIYVDPDTNPKVGRPPIDYLLTADAVKILCMLEQSQLGDSIRRFFVQVEKALRLAALKLAETEQELRRSVTAKYDELQASTTPAVQFYKAVAASNEARHWFTMKEAAAFLTQHRLAEDKTPVGHHTLMQVLRKRGHLLSGDDSVNNLNMPSASMLGLKLMEYRMVAHPHADAKQRTMVPTFTGAGLQWLLNNYQDAADEQ